MDMEAAMRARLLADPAIAALVGTRVYWIERPQATLLEAITLQHVTDERRTNYDDFDGMQPGYVQVDVWASSYAKGKAIKEAVIAALAPAGEHGGVRFTRAFPDARDLSERVDTKTIFRPSIDFTFFYGQA